MKQLGDWAKYVQMVCLFFKIVYLKCVCYMLVFVLVKRARRGIAEAQVTLGVMYSKGICVEQDKVKAFYWYHKAAVQGNSSARFIIGIKYALGDGVFQNYVEAIRWISEAAGQNHSQAQLALEVISFMKETGFKHWGGFTKD